MIKTLELVNCFTHKDRKFDFTKGLTAITGPNWSGKSLILEMIQYALWGSSALRGVGPDYKGLSVTLTFEVKGVEYTVKRSGSTVRLTRGTTDIASGTKAVNPHIRSLFGYSFDVFKMSNAINQGKIEELGAMLPAARKKLVDQTIGLDRLDVVHEWVADQERDLRATIAAAEKYLLAPVEPKEFHVKHSAAELLAVKTVLEEQLVTYRALEAQANVVITVPQEVTGDVSELEATQAARQLALAQQRTIQQTLANLQDPGPEPTPHPLQDKHSELLLETEEVKGLLSQKKQAEDMLATIPEAELDQDFVDQAEAKNLLIKRWEERKALRAKLTEYVCPACDHHWHDADPRLDDYKDVPEELPDYTKVSVALLNIAKKALAQASVRQGLVDALVLLDERLQGKKDWTKELKDISDSVTAQRVYQERLRQHDTKLELQAKLAAIVVPEDVSGHLKALKQYLSDLEVYRTKKLSRDTAISALAEMPSDLEAKVDQAAADWLGRRDYENALGVYKIAKDLYDAQVAEVQKAKADLAEWGKCKQAISTLRQRVKGYLLPSLNRVASNLLQTMTAGEMNWIVVSEDFDITVDGKRLETLSGAGKSVANLALRIGLGQVLTNRTFSVLLLDEIDASCDDARAAAIAESLQRLTGQIQQIIQVSHKQGLVADHHVRL